MKWNGRAAVALFCFTSQILHIDSARINSHTLWTFFLFIYCKSDYFHCFCIVFTVYENDAKRLKT